MAILYFMVFIPILTFQATFCSRISFQHYQLNQIYENKTCDETLFARDDVSMIQCVRICSMEEFCAGVTFSNVSNVRKCFGCSHSSFSHMKGDEGFSVYQKENMLEISKGIDETIPESHHTQSALPLIGGGKGIKPIQVLEVDNGIEDGNWTEPVFCSKGFYAVGFTMRLDEYKGLEDFTGANSVKLKCFNPFSKSFGEEICPHPGFWGEWYAYQFCNYTNGDVMKSVMAKVDPYVKFVDDAGLTNLRFQCGHLDGETISNTIEMPISSEAEEFGTWGNWSEQCRAGHGICGTRIQILDKEPLFHDDKAMINIALYCC